MKRLGNIFDSVIDRENLAAAFNRVCRGKRGRGDIRLFATNIEENLNVLHRELAEERFKFGKYNFFKIHDPKERIIAAAPVRERIVHHALIAVIGERLERSLVDKSYACRKGKGQWAAVAEAQRLAAKHEWCLKLDIHHFFDTIDHEILLRLLSRKIKDKRVMSILRQLIESYETEPGKGLPIGNLTSQYFANLYLDGLDRFLSKPGDDVREQTNAVDSIRYMDDVLVFGSHEALRRIMRAVPTFLLEALKLQLKAKGGLHRTTRGVEFLGTRVFPRHVGLSRRSKIRFRRKVALLDGMLAEGRMSEHRYQIRMTQLFAFVRNCDTEELRRKVISEGAQGELSPRARRVLEQQQQRGLCRRLPQRVSEQQLQQQHEPEQQQQQLGLSRVLFSRSSRAENENRLNRSPSRTAIFGGQTLNILCGVGRRDAECHAGRLYRRQSTAIESNRATPATQGVAAG